MNLFKFPHAFVAGAKAKAEEVNANFEEAENEINDNLRPGLFISGDLKATARAAAPEGWLMCEGQAVSRSTYKALFDAIGTTYGKGDGGTTFNVPDLRGRVPVGVDGAAGRISSSEALGNTGGSEKLRKHKHAVFGNTSGVSNNHQHNLPAMFESTRHDGSGAGYNNWNAGAGAPVTGVENSNHVHLVDLLSSATGEGVEDGIQLPPYQIVSWMVKT